MGEDNKNKKPTVPPLKRTANQTERIYSGETKNKEPIEEMVKASNPYSQKNNDEETKTTTSQTKPAVAEKTEVQNVEDIYKPYFDAEDKRLETEQKRAKRNKLFAGISDGISAVANLYAVSQGAPNQFTPQSALSGKAAERYDNITKERNSNKLAYNNIMYQARRTDKDFDIKRMVNEISRQRLGLDQAKAVADANYKNAMVNLKAKEQELNDKKFELDEKLKNHQITEAEHKAKIAEINAEYQPKIKEAEIALTNAKTAQAKASKEYTQKRTKTIGKEKVIDYDYENDPADPLRPKITRRRERYVSPTDGNDEEIEEWSGE